MRPSGLVFVRAVATSFQVVRLGGARTKCGYNNDIHDRPFRAHPQRCEHYRANSSQESWFFPGNTWCLQFLCALDLDHRSVSEYDAWLTRVARAARLKKWYGHGRTGRTGAYGHVCRCHGQLLYCRDITNMSIVIMPNNKKN